MKRFVMTLLVALCMIAEVRAAVPEQITIQGRLSDSTGIPMSAVTVSMGFLIYDAESGGNILWSGEEQSITTDSSGLWTAYLGAVIPLTPDVLSDSDRWLQIIVDDAGDVTQLPRTRLATVPFAFHVGTVDGASGGTITSKLTIGPGNANTGTNGFVAGQSNTAHGDHSSISGGKQNLTLSPVGTIGGGAGNTIQGDSATIGGGSTNNINGNNATISGGARNAITGAGSTIAGGTHNIIFLTPGFSGTISGGNNNIISGTGTEATVGGGTSNTASGNRSTVAGGGGNDATGSGSTVSGGGANTAEGNNSTIGGGSNNVASGENAVIGGGSANQATEHVSVVAGGASNSATGSLSFVGGGSGNDATARYSSILGGESNEASDTGASVLGGIQNVASGQNSSVLGGIVNVASADNSIAAGVRAHADDNNSFVWSSDVSNDRSSDTTRQFKVHAQNGANFGAEAGAAKPIRLGDHYRDNGVVAWGRINANGTISSEFGVTSVSHPGTGLYTITIDAAATTLIPVATAIVGAAPTTAAAARLTYAIPVTSQSFTVAMTNGSHVATDNDFTFIVTAR